MNWKIIGMTLGLFGILGGSGFAAAGSSRSDVAERNYKTDMAEQSLGLEKTDPELEAMMKGCIYGDIMEQARLTRREQHLVTLATLTASGAQDLLEKNVRGALTDGVTPLDVREAIYHLAPYIGFPKVLTAMERVNRVFKEEGVKLPLENQAATTDGDRLEKGLAFQVATYGERIVTMLKNTPANQKHLQDDLSAFCFGDIYTRRSLDLKTREMLTVAAIGTLGNDEPQFKSHVRGYLAAGATEDEVIGVLTVLNPYVGFPRTLNNLRAANEAIPKK